MADYYCHACIRSGNLVSIAVPVDLTGTQYQLAKFIKHTIPTGNYPVNSIFNDRTIQAYHGYIVNTSASGCLEVDDMGRKNMVWVAGKTVGGTIQHNLAVTPNDAVKVVLPENASALHAFPTASSSLRVQTCRACGKQIVN
jgi:hypothetical protein